MNCLLEMGRGFWREGAGEWAFSTLDVRLRNLLFKGDVLKIADMGQSRILMAGQTGMDTATNGGTQGWMSPEEIKWDQVCVCRRRAHMTAVGDRSAIDLHVCMLAPDSVALACTTGWAPRGRALPCAPLGRHSQRRLHLVLHPLGRPPGPHAARF